MELEEVGFVQGCDDGVQRAGEQAEERVVRDVPGGDDEELSGAPGQQVTVAEVAVLGDDNAALRVSPFCDLGVGGSVAVGESPVWVAPWQAARKTATRAGSARRRETSRAELDRVSARGEGAELEGGE